VSFNKPENIAFSSTTPYTVNRSVTGVCLKVLALEGKGEEPILVPPHVSYMMEWGKRDFVSFWDWAARQTFSDIFWLRVWDKTFEWGDKTFYWYKGAITNISYSALDYKVAQGNGNRTAFIYENPETGEYKAVTYSQLLSMVEKYAAALRGMGVKKGDRVLIYMPTRIESAALMLASARIGAIHAAVFAGFSAAAVADRIELTGAKWVFTQDYNVRRGKVINLKETIDKAIDSLGGKAGIERVVVFESGIKGSVEMKRERDITWGEWLDHAADGKPDVEWMEANEPLFILPTSGTTAKPKPTVQRHGGYQVYVYLMEKWVYGMSRDDVWFCTSDIGWIVGHSYVVYGPLLAGATSIIYDGVPDYPRSDMWWEVIEKYKATALWTSPTGARMLMKLGLDKAKRHDLSSIKRVFTAGEPLNPPVLRWLMYDVFEGRVPVIDHMWQTETSGPLVANTYGISMYPIKPGSAGMGVPGVHVEVVNPDTGKPVAPGERGVVIVRNPFPGLTPTLWGDPERYWRSYWEARPALRGVYFTGDAAYIDGDGYIYFVGRADEVIKIAAHRIGTIEVESVLLSHPAVAEAAVVGVPDPIRGEAAVAFVVLRPGYEPSDKLREELINHVRTNYGPIVVFKGLEFVNMLPKTRSGKIMRRVLRRLWTGEPLGDLSTLEEEASIEEVKEAISKLKFLISAEEKRAEEAIRKLDEG